MSESRLVTTILEYLAWLRVTAWRMNSGTIVIDNPGTKRRVVRGAPAGTADIVGIAPGGRFLAIECKIGRNKPTEAQSEFLRMVEEAGGIAILAYSVDDVTAGLQAAGVEVGIVI